MAELLPSHAIALSCKCRACIVTAVFLIGKHNLKKLVLKNMELLVIEQIVETP